MPIPLTSSELRNSGLTITPRMALRTGGALFLTSGAADTLPPVIDLLIERPASCTIGNSKGTAAWAAGDAGAAAPLAGAVDLPAAGALSPAADAFSHG